MLHEAIFLATCNATNVCVASCRKKFTCNTPFCNCSCCVASSKKSRTTLYSSQRCEKSCLRATSPLQLERFFIRHRCVASCKKNCLCNMALSACVYLKTKHSQQSLTRKYHVITEGCRIYYAVVMTPVPSFFR